MTYLDVDETTPLNWFEGALIYGMAERWGDNAPVILWKGVEFHKLLPNDNYTGLTFFYEHDSRQLDHGIIEYDLSLVVWFDQGKINDGLPYRVSEWLIEEIRNEFLDLDEISGIRLFKDKKNIYNDFDIELDNAKFNHRFDGFRIRFNLTANADCGNTFKKKVVSMV